MGLFENFPYTNFHRMNLDWLLTEMKRLIEEWADMQQNFNDLETAFQDLKNYCENYFATLDLSQEVSDVLDRMLADGDLDPIINPKIASEVSQWLADNIGPTTPAIDASLSVPGAGADAAVTGRRFSEANADAHDLGSYLFSSNVWQKMQRDDVISGSNVFMTGGTHILIPINGGDTIDITSRIDKATIFAFLTSTEHVTGSAAPFCSGETRRTLTANSSGSYTAPSDAKYLYLTYIYTDNFWPRVLNINGLPANYAIFDYVTKLFKYVPKMGADFANGDDIDAITDMVIRSKPAAGTLSGTLPSSFNTGHSWTLISIPYGTAPSSTQTRFTQFMIERFTGQIASREFRSGVWQPWHEYAQTSDISDYADNTIVDLTTDAFTGSTPNKGYKVRVMSYNVANYNNDTAIYISNEKRFNVKKLLSEVNADFICVQEDRQYTDSGNSMSSHSNIYQPIYPFKYGSGGTTIYSKIASNGDEGILEYTNGRTLRFAVFPYEGKKLMIVCTHPVYDYNNTGGESATSISARQTQYDELFKWINGQITLNVYGTTTPHSVPAFDYCIIGGDMNSCTATDHSNLKTIMSNNNAVGANGCWLGWLETSVVGTSLDNVIGDSNTIIDSVKVLKSWYNRLYSDHYPMYADLTLLA